MLFSICLGKRNAEVIKFIGIFKRIISENEIYFCSRKKSCEPELSFILAELFNKCLEVSCFPDCWKVSSVIPVFKNVGEKTTAKNCFPVSLLSVVSKVLEKFVNNRVVDHLDKCGPFPDFQYGFRSSQSMQIFSQFYLIELLGFVTGLGLLER